MDGQPFWDEAQVSFFQIPSVDQIVNALRTLYKADRAKSQVAIDFASQFDVEKVWNDSWMPFLKDLFK